VSRIAGGFGPVPVRITARDRFLQAQGVTASSSPRRLLWGVRIIPQGELGTSRKKAAQLKPRILANEMTEPVALAILALLANDEVFATSRAELFPDPAFSWSIPMKQFLLAFMLISIPVAAFSGFEMYFSPSASSAASLGDLSNLKEIVTDVQSIAKTRDFGAAERRITDFEAAWDDAESTVRPKNPAAWGAVDEAADAAIHALRTNAPDAAHVNNTLSALIAVLDKPPGTVDSGGGPRLVSGTPVTDAVGHPIACEELIKALGVAIESGKIAQTDMAAAKDFHSKAIGRCNADDDASADEFSAQGLALAGR